MRKFAALAVVCLVYIVVLAMYTLAEDPEPFNVEDYCGIPASPADIPAIPRISQASKTLGARLTDFFIFTRHGDRSTIVKNCFDGLPEYKNREWIECPHNTIGFHAGLKKRNSYAPTYAFPIHPLNGKQVLDGNCHLGQLTQRGLLMSHNNGKRIGSYLSDTFTMIGSNWSPQSLELRSTDVHRTRETAEGFITGLLDTMTGTPEQLASQLPPLTFVDSEVDALRLNTNVCKTGPYTERAYASDEWKQYKADIWDPLTEELKVALNQPTASIADTFDCMKPLQCHGVDQPVTSDLSKRVEDAATEYYRFTFDYDKIESSQLFTGAFLAELSAMWSKSAAKSLDSNPMVYLFSGHDFGPMMNLVSALTFPRLIWPPYSAMANVEFFRTPEAIDGEDTFMRFLYLGEVIIPDFCKDQVVGDELCPVSVTLDYLATVLPTAAQCPGIPRMALGEYHETIKASSFQLKGDCGMMNIKTGKAADRLYEKLHQLDQDLAIVQEQERLQTRRAKSHAEHWADLR